MVKEIVTRFAPSPTGRLHLGHAYSALEAWQFAREHSGRFILRIEDIDKGRCRSRYERAIFEDLAWLGLEWETPVRRQSEHMEDYAEALEELSAMDLTYPCFCTRKDIAAEARASASAPHGSAARIYPGTCRKLSSGDRKQRIDAGQPFAIRLDMAAAKERLVNDSAWPLSWSEIDSQAIIAQPEIHGDVVLARKDIPTSYHLSATLDDHLQGITHVIRGRDLEASTHVHRILQALLKLRIPIYRHHRLVVDDEGRRLAKRDRGVTISGLRERGMTPQDVRRLLAEVETI